MDARPGSPATSAPVAGSATQQWSRWAESAGTGVVVAWLMFATALFSTMPAELRWHLEGGRPVPGTNDPYDPRYPDPAGPWSVSLVDAAWLPILLLACLCVGAGLALCRSRPRAGYLLVVVGCAGYLMLGGSLLVSLVAPAIALVSLTAAVDVGVSWLGWVALLVPMVSAVGWRHPYLGLTSPWLYPAIVFGIAAMLVPTLAVEVRRTRGVSRRRAHEEEMRQVAYRERLRIAQDLHDVVGHSLSSISLQAAVALRLFDEHPDQARTSLEAIRTSAKDSLDDVRRTLGILRDPNEVAPRSPGPGLDRIDDLVAPLVAGGATITVHRDGAPGATVPTPVQQVAYRVVQEGLTNAVRHAPDTPVDVRITRGEDQLRVEVRNGGPAPTCPLVEGNGLRGMRERVTSLGGTLAIEDTGPGGVGIIAVLPLEATDTGGNR